MTPRDVLDFWFPEATPYDCAGKQRWWTKDPAFDEEIRRRFGPERDAAARRERHGWRTDPEGLVALVVLVDQFSRNLFRGSPESWAADPYARELVAEARASGLDLQAPPLHRGVLYMPLMHSEDLAIQEQGVEAFSALADSVPEEHRGSFAGYVDFARRHRDVVARFGRFPHRNAVLGRDTTPQEQVYLDAGGGF